MGIRFDHDFQNLFKIIKYKLKNKLHLHLGIIKS